MFIAFLNSIERLTLSPNSLNILSEKINFTEQQILFFIFFAKDENLST